MPCQLIPATNYDTLPVAFRPNQALARALAAAIGSRMRDAYMLPEDDGSFDELLARLDAVPLGNLAAQGSA